MTTEIRQEIELLENTKEDLTLAIMEKGVVVQPSDLFSTYPTRISQITTTPGDKDSLFQSIIDRSITSLTVPTGTTVLRPQLFSGCVNLTTLTLPNTLKVIKGGALSGAIAVTSLTIPDSVTTIEGSSSFHQTSSLTDLTIGTGVTFIGNMAFYGNPNLTSITINATTPPTLGSNNNAFDSTNNCPIYVPQASVDAYKTAWPTYASRIQAIVVPHFEMIINDIQVTDGKYLITCFTGSGLYAMNTPLIKDTTTSYVDGINNVYTSYGDSNYLNIYPYQSAPPSTLNTLDVTPQLLRIAVDYDATNKKLSWTDPDTSTTYYLYSGFNKVNSNYGKFNAAATTMPSSNINVNYWGLGGYGDLTIYYFNFGGLKLYSGEHSAYGAYGGFLWQYLRNTNSSSRDTFEPTLYKLVQ